jgi:hypothetical protein
MKVCRGEIAPVVAMDAFLPKWQTEKLVSETVVINGQVEVAKESAPGAETLLSSLCNLASAWFAPNSIGVNTLDLSILLQ